MMVYDDFRVKIAAALEAAPRPLTWTEVRTAAALPQLFPNNQWVHRLESDIGLKRTRDAAGGMIHWQINDAAAATDVSTPKTPKPRRARPSRQSGDME
jgi:hypothetical protein